MDWGMILGVLIITLLFVAAGVILWLAFGRKKKGDDKMVGGLDLKAHMNNLGGSNSSGTPRR